MLWLASSLIARGHEAVVRMPSGASLVDDVAASIEANRPKYVAISCKWWNTLYGAMEVARAVRRSFPGLPIVAGGHTASAFPQELIGTGLFDIVLLGDVDESLIELVGNHQVSHGYTRSGYHPPLSRSGQTLIDNVPLAPLDVMVDQEALVPGYVWTGRGCCRECFYCFENRETGRRILGRERPRLRAAEAVALDVDRLQSHSQLILDYEHPSPGRTFRFMAELIERLPRRIVSCYYFHWGLPTPALLDLLSARFNHVGICLDVQAFAEQHRKQLANERLIKPYFSDRALLDVLEHAARCGNIDVDASGIIGMPLETPADRERGTALIEELTEQNECVRDWRFSPLHVIPGTSLAAESKFYNLEVVRRNFEDFAAFTEESYERELPYYARARRHHPYGVHPVGQPYAIVDFMAEAEARFAKVRAAKQDVRLAVQGDGATIHLRDPYAPLASLFRMLDDGRLTKAAPRQLAIHLGPRTWFHNAWTDYTSESGENSSTRSDIKKNASPNTVLADQFARFERVVLEPPTAQWGVVGAALADQPARRTLTASGIELSLP
jgi:radical SAM superfamily enzyme YgiQ (UPF0313 family)